VDKENENNNEGDSEDENVKHRDAERYRKLTNRLAV
jgi:hypothetical protein